MRCHIVALSLQVVNLFAVPACDVAMVVAIAFVVAAAGAYEVGSKRRFSYAATDGVDYLELVFFETMGSGDGGLLSLLHLTGRNPPSEPRESVLLVDGLQLGGVVL